MIKAIVNNIECIFYFDERFLPKHAPIGYPYMYQLRHDEEDWTCPISIEKVVYVNFFGTVFMKKPLNFGQDYYLDIEKFEVENKYSKIKFETSILKQLFSKDGE